MLKRNIKYTERQANEAGALFAKQLRTVRQKVFDHLQVDRCLRKRYALKV